ncbi:MAG: helix-turn-helix transcriptional regulator [Lentisphaeraceae bacterium]|nr:helix-turn-helix transcriptional regulator [Lentisphaeraceae bacterium]
MSLLNNNTDCRILPNSMERFGRSRPTLIPELPVISWRQVETPLRDFFRPHYFPHYNLVLVSSGSFECWVQGRLRHIKEGQMILFKPYEVLATLANSLFHGRIYSFQFDLYNQQALSFCSEKEKQSITERLHNFTSTPLSTQTVMPLIENIFDEHRQPLETSPFICRQLLNEILIKLLREQKSHFGKNNLAVCKAAEIMNVVEKLTNFSNNPTVNIDNLASHFGYTRVRFCRIFKSISGITLVKYLQYKRFNRATKALIESDASITDICFELGFSTSQYFSKFFKKICAISPQEYRRASADKERYDPQKAINGNDASTILDKGFKRI